jgi:hypothetical protein
MDMFDNDNDSFYFNRESANKFEERRGDWHDYPMPGVPDVNGDGKSTYADLESIIFTNLVWSNLRPTSVDASYDRTQNAVTVSYTGQDGNSTTVATYDYDQNSLTYWNGEIF